MSASLNELALEERIKELKLDAPRLTLEYIYSKVVGETYTILPSKKSMVCELTLENGYTVRGESACVSISNFNEEIGMAVSKENAIHKVWELEGYLLQEKLFRNEC